MPLDSAPAPWRRIVVCLNFWQDLPALQLSVPLWLGHVDAVLAVDGAYGSHDGAHLSTDGSREFLSAIPKVQLIDAPAGVTQIEKRNLYLRAAQAGDCLVVIDADEMVTGAEVLRTIPNLDVGWVRIGSPLYTREYGQPRVFRAHPALAYRGRHHWMYIGDQLLTTHQYGGAGFEHRLVNLRLDNRRNFGHTASRRMAKSKAIVTQVRTEKTAVAAPHTAMSDNAFSRRECLRVFQYAMYDAGMAPSRLHTALNRTTPHASLFWKLREGPFGVEGQYMYEQHQAQLKTALGTADILHFHLQIPPNMVQKGKPVVLHHHGSMLRNRQATLYAMGVRHKALQLVSNLELLSYGANMHWLPNVVPYARYHMLVDQFAPITSSPFRVCHSPSRRQLKGTDEFLAACDRLNAKGIAIQPVLIEGVNHDQALMMKATCHASFDSFWLGIQCSGLEAACMNMPVIAGDDTVAQRYTELLGQVPYTFANNGQQLEEQLARLATDATFWQAEQRRVAEYVLAHHDEAMVTLRYLDLLDTAFHWRQKSA